MAPAAWVIPLVITSTSIDPCLRDALEVDPVDRARIMCVLGNEVRTLRELKACPTCPEIPELPPPIVKRENNWLELAGVGIVSAVIGGVIAAVAVAVSK